MKPLVFLLYIHYVCLKTCCVGSVILIVCNVFYKLFVGLK